MLAVYIWFIVFALNNLICWSDQSAVKRFIILLIIRCGKRQKADIDGIAFIDNNDNGIYDWKNEDGTTYSSDKPASGLSSFGARVHASVFSSQIYLLIPTSIPAKDNASSPNIIRGYDIADSRDVANYNIGYTIRQSFLKFFRKAVFFSGIFIRVYISVIIDIIKHPSWNLCIVIFMIRRIVWNNRSYKIYSKRSELYGRLQTESKYDTSWLSYNKAYGKRRGYNAECAS